MHTMLTFYYVNSKITVYPLNNIFFFERKTNTKLLLLLDLVPAGLPATLMCVAGRQVPAGDSPPGREDFFLFLLKFFFLFIFALLSLFKW